MCAAPTQISAVEELADPLAQKPASPDRLFFATGILLDAEDFKAEQLYHRGRLCRALAYLHGSGTIAGLLVTLQEPNLSAGVQEEIKLSPGLAIDRLGRLIEVPSQACIRLGRWYEQQPAGELLKAFHPAAAGDPANVVVVDVFIRFYSCERGKTPAFATGPFDALDAVQPARMREFYKLELVPREHADPDLLNVDRPDLSGITDDRERLAMIHEEILNGWQEGTEEAGGQWKKNGKLAPLKEHEANQDPTSVFLARLSIPAGSSSQAGGKPVRDLQRPVAIDNQSRRFIYTAASLARWLGVWTMR